MSETECLRSLEKYLNQSALFANLDAETIAHIASKCDLVRFNQGEDLFKEGDLPDYLYIIGEGEVSVLKKMGEGQHELARLGAGEHLGEMAMISSARRSATVQAASLVECVRMDETGFNELLDSDARFSQRMLKALAVRLRDTDEAAMQDMVLAHQALSFSLAKLADSRDPETGGHLYRVREYCLLLAELLKKQPKYADILTDSFMENIYLVAPLHDIGKVAIPDGILLKKGKLTEAEFEIMSTHTTLGAHAVDTVLEFCDFEMFHMAKRVILGHHERFDGQGYPHGVAGEDIPIEARIMSIADIYDALLSARVYKPAFDYVQAKDEIASQSGIRLDPDIVKVMLDNIEKFEEVHRKLADPSAEPASLD